MKANYVDLKKYGTITNNKLEVAKKLADKSIYDLILLYYDSYYNTDQDIDEFAAEFYKVVDNLRLSIIPLKLNKLSVSEICDEIIQILEG